MPYADVNGIRVFYELEGRGPALVLVHEFAGASSSWAPQVEAFRERYRVLTYNCRGYPPSAVPADVGAYSQDHSIEDLRALLDHLGIDQARLVGFSMGGAIALNFAIRYPAKVRALVIAGAGSGSDDKAGFATWFGAVADRLEDEGTGPVADDYLQGPTRIPLRRKRPHVWEAMRAQFVQLPVVGLANTIRGTITPRPTVYELEGALRRMNVPTLVLVGEVDGPALEPSRFLAATIPGASLDVFSRSGHAINLEEPERFNRAVLEFLAGAGST